MRIEEHSKCSEEVKIAQWMLSWECKEWTETDKWMYQQFIKWNDYSDVKCHPQYGIGNYMSCAQSRNMSHMDMCNMKSQVNVLLLS